jgi:hypothetical protein
VDWHVARMESQKHVAEVPDDNSADRLATNQGACYIIHTELGAIQVL